METYLPYFWLAVIIVAAVVEGSTAQLVSIWFVAGGVGALIANLCGAELWTQTVVFVVVTAITLVSTRPLVKKLMNFKKEETNADRYIGKDGIVIAEINNTLGVGQVNVLGSVWTARSEDGSVIKIGEHVLIKAIEGVKLIVTVHNGMKEEE
ncbi:NfeD family protein [Clostridium sp. KNHs216]|jgi:membrane protein implicated in regulation of membrane protease activity|uniref:NfeD family protein n=1 Tax=Eubacteriales TaxID=186802 RepID=UPI00056FDFA5|nr:NfeD family protein [Clostridium sp. KNHs216]MBE6831296.1 NfeD family protein [Oscillospiraceae bacterium]TQI65805.1 membrane protein implicated in regulation of membrane protease activity [Clostridium sp. KNHs216]